MIQVALDQRGRLQLAQTCGPQPEPEAAECLERIEPTPRGVRYAWDNTEWTGYQLVPEAIAAAGMRPIRPMSPIGPIPSEEWPVDAPFADD